MPGNAIDDRLMTAEELSQYLGLAVGTIYNKANRDEIPSVKVGRMLRFRRSEIDAWIAEQNPREPGAAEAAS